MKNKHQKQEQLFIYLKIFSNNQLFSLFSHSHHAPASQIEYGYQANQQEHKIYVHRHTAPFFYRLGKLLAQAPRFIARNCNYYIPDVSALAKEHGCGYETGGTLISRGPDELEAVDVLARGLLR